MSTLRGPLHFISVETLVEKHNELNLALLAYPSGEPTRVREILSEMLRCGVSALGFEESSGKISPFLLGKGVRGMVFLGLSGEDKVAVKVARTDAAVSSVIREAENQLKANTVGVGPRLISFSSNIIVMQLIEGTIFADYVQQHRGSQLYEIVDKIFDQAYSLDVIRLDHGQLSNSSDHVIVTAAKIPFIIDFSHSSQSRKPKNVTAFTSYLIRKVLPQKIDDPTVQGLLKLYKQQPSQQSLSMLKEAFRKHFATL